MIKRITIDGKERKLCNNALLPRRFRNQFGKDLIIEMEKIAKTAKEDPQAVNFEVLENLTWLMLKEAGEDVGEQPEEWLASIDDLLGFYKIMPEVAAFWQSGTTTTATPKKNKKNNQGA